MFSHKLTDIISMLNRLNGRLKIILGNHDQPLMKAYLRGEFRNYDEKIYIAPNIYDVKVFTSTSRKPEKVTLCHYPMLSWNGSHYGRKLFYGHVHSNVPRLYENGTICNAYNVSADILGLVPHTFEDIIKINNELYILGNV